MMQVGRVFYETTSYIPVSILYETPATAPAVLEGAVMHVLNDSVGLSLTKEKSQLETQLHDSSYSSNEGESSLRFGL